MLERGNVPLFFDITHTPTRTRFIAHLKKRAGLLCTYNNKTTMTKEQKELCERIEKDTDCIVELAYIINNDMPSDIDELIEKCEELIYQHEVIGYYNAMQYLKENDMSLSDSIGIAVEYGTSLENITSELLATLLQQRDTLETLNEYREELETVFFS